MPVVINTNTAATNAAYNLNISNAQLQKSLARLSSGSKITSPADDAGGLAVSMRMSAAIRRTDATITNVSNAISFLQTQDGVLKTVGDILNRVAELATLAQDVTKSATDKQNYDKEFVALREQLNNLTKAEFNKVKLFAESGASVTQLTVVTSEDGSLSQNITLAGLEDAISAILDANDNDISTGTLTAAAIDNAITEVAKLRAQNGGETSNLNFALNVLAINRTNLEAANSRIIDVDVAEESTRLARYNILVQAGTAMLAQANASSQLALRLLQ